MIVGTRGPEEVTKAQPWEASRSPHWWFPPPPTTCCLALGLGENVGRQATEREGARHPKDVPQPG